MRRALKIAGRILLVIAAIAFIIAGGLLIGALTY